MINKELIRLKTIYYLLLGSQIFIFTITLIIHQKAGILLTNYNINNDIFINILPIIGLTYLPLAFYVYSKKCKKGKELENIEHKLRIYKSASLTKYILFKVPGILSLFAYFLSSQEQYSYIFIVAFIVLLFNKPSKERFVKDMKLSINQRATILIKN